ncbi:CGNR zinc finger domain-containing protein [Streptomyces sp. NPDC001255]|uniref:CGNR zinc finger domain-containing protein n=1 Tax=Streptomyces sp. NPDC001255 TaxID=3364550 RepID=UPI00367BCBE4
MVIEKRTSSALRKVRFDGGSLVLNLTATVGRRGAGAAHRIERLCDVDALGRWCTGVGMEVAPEVDRERLLAELRELREDAWEVLSAVVHEVPVGTSTLRRLEEWASAPVPLPRLVSTSRGPEARTPALGTKGICSRAARDLLFILAEPDARSRLRECASDDCRMIYLVPLGARERRWCSMSQCGNRAKAAAHRARATQATGS